MNRIAAAPHSASQHPAAKPTGAQLLGQAIGVALALGGSQALAQEATSTAAGSPPPQPQPPNKATVTQLPKVEVHADDLEPTSPKLTAPIVDTPMSVTILPQSVMQETAAISLQDALRNVPGITFAAGEGGTPTGDLPSIRGFNSTTNIYVDGMRDLGLQNRDIFDLEQIEVIKGPDSSIAGRSAGGGSLNLVSKSAEDNDFIEALGTYGSAGQYRTSIDGNLKLADGIAARLNVMKMGGGVPGRDSAVRTDKVGVAPTITFGLDSPTRLILGYYHFEDESTPDYGVPVDFFSTGKPLVETQGISRENYYGLTDRDFRDNKVDSGEARFEHDFNTALTLRSQVRYTLSHNNYVLTLPYLPQDANGNEEPGLVYRLPIGNADQERSLISETDLIGHFETGPIHHDMNVGFEVSKEQEQEAGGGSYLGYNVVSPSGLQGFYGNDCSSPSMLASHDCTSLYNPNPHDPWQGTVTRNTDYSYFTTRDFAPYAFDTITLTPHWKINAGLRWEKYRTEANSPSDPEGVDASDSMSFTSYQLGLMYKPLDSGTIYVSTSSSAIPEDLAFSGGGQDQAFPSGPYNPSSTGIKPEKTRTVEIGTKWNLFGNRLLLSGDIFDERHTNAAVATAPGIYVQIGKTRVKGVELSANGSITEDWNLIAGYSYLDAKIVQGGIYDEVGHQLANTPPNTFSLWSTYRAMSAVTVGAGAYYRDRQIGYAGPPDEYIDSYTRFDSMARWQANPHIALQANVQNIFNTQYYSKSFYWYALPAAGRTWMLTVDLKL